MLVMPSAKRMRFTYWLPWLILRLVFRFISAGGRSTWTGVPLEGSVILAFKPCELSRSTTGGRGDSSDINYLAREILFRFPVVGWMLLNWNSVPVDREKRCCGGTKSDSRPAFEGRSNHTLS